MSKSNEQEQPARCDGPQSLRSCRLQWQQQVGRRASEFDKECRRPPQQVMRICSACDRRGMQAGRWSTPCFRRSGSRTIHSQSSNGSPNSAGQQSPSESSLRRCSKRNPILAQVEVDTLAEFKAADTEGQRNLAALSYDADVALLFDLLAGDLHDNCMPLWGAYRSSFHRRRAHFTLKQDGVIHEVTECLVGLRAAERRKPLVKP